MLSSKTKAVLVSSIGGGLEMYDFTIYVFFAPIIAAHFFPRGNPVVSLLETFAVFAVGYFARPIGAIIFGNYGDVRGRKKGMLITIAIMAIATTLMGLLPTYASIGILAPIILIILRLLQGIAVGGDLPGAIAFVAEHADNHNRGLACSIVYCAVNLGILLASIAGALLTLLLTQEHLASWGWRIAFILGLVIGVVGFYLRTKIAETPYFTNMVESKTVVKIPFGPLFKNYTSRIIQGIGLAWLFAVVIALIFLYMPTYLNTIAHLGLKDALTLNSINIFIFSACIPLMGYWSDRVGRKPMLIITALLFILLAYPIYTALSGSAFHFQCLALFCLAILSAGIVGVAPVTLAEMFPTKIRFSGIAVTYNMGFAIFAGLTPVIVTYLIYQFHSPKAPSYYLIISAVVTLIAVLTFKEKSGKPLES